MNQDKKQNIDLGHRLSTNHFELIELKIDDKTPVHAAFQILMNCLLYLFYRKHFPTMAHNEALLGAEVVDLKVVAPIEFYQRLCLDCLERSLNLGIRAYCAGCDIAMSFSLETLPDYWRHEDPHLKAVCIIASRQPLYRSNSTALAIPNA